MEAENTHFDLIPLFTGRGSPYYSGAVNCGIPKHSPKLTGNVSQCRFGARRKKQNKTKATTAERRELSLLIGVIIKAVSLALAARVRETCAATWKGEGQFSPGQGHVRNPAGRGKLLLQIRIRK